MNKFNININRIKRQVLSNVKILRFVFIFVILIILFVIGILLFKGIKNSIVGSYISAGKYFLIPDSNKVIVDQERINLLLLGKGDLSHDAPELTDTMIVLSISPTKKNVVLISVPRDIWVLGFRDKINASYLIGNEKQPDRGGFALAKASVQDVLGIEIPYAVLVDFNGFKEVINAMGGVEVDVKTNFTDSQYPIAGRENDTCDGDKTFKCRYMTVSFEKGQQMMDGDRALIFVRSRHGDNDEGNDIAREARQQLLLRSVFAKLTKPNTLLNIDTSRKLFGILNKYVKTDMKANEIAIAARYAFDARGDLKASVIPENLLFNPLNQYLYSNDKFDHAFVFVPNNKDQSWKDVHEFVRSLLD